MGQGRVAASTTATRETTAGLAMAGPGRSAHAFPNFISAELLSSRSRHAECPHPPSMRDTRLVDLASFCRAIAYSKAVIPDGVDSTASASFR
jgi:hypothetical protein